MIERITMVNPVYSAVTRGGGNQSTLQGVTLSFGLTDSRRAVVFISSQSGNLWRGRPRENPSAVSATCSLEFVDWHPHTGWAEYVCSSQFMVPWLGECEKYYRHLVDPSRAIEYHLTLLEYGSDALWGKLEETWESVFGGLVVSSSGEEKYKRVLQLSITPG